MSDDRPILFQWSEDEVFVPVGKFWLSKAREQYAIGEKIALVQHFERSSASHAFFFARLSEIWATLPDHLAAQFPTVEHLRKHALIACGYADKESLVCSSKAEARRVAAFISRGDDYAIVKVEDAVVVKWTAQSMAYRSMNKAKWQEVSGKVLDWCAALVGAKASDVQESA